MAYPLALAKDSSSPHLLPGAYLTDGINLFCVVSTTIGPDSAALVTLEDCRTLDLLLYPLEEVRQRPLRLVRGSRAGEQEAEASQVG